MAISEAARADLYTGLSEVLGRDRAETLMAYLPTFDPTDIATRADIENLRQEMNRRFEQVDQRFEQIDRRFEQVDQRFEQIDRRFAAVNGRLDRLFQTLVAGLFVIIAAMVGLVVLAP